MTALPPDNRGADRSADFQVATGDELFEPGEAPLPTVAGSLEPQDRKLGRGGDVQGGPPKGIRRRSRR